MYEEVRLKEISSISGSVYSQGLKWKESSDNNSDGREETEQQPSQHKQKYRGEICPPQCSPLGTTKPKSSLKK